jgi:hypothetical protein
VFTTVAKTFTADDGIYTGAKFNLAEMVRTATNATPNAPKGEIAQKVDFATKMLEDMQEAMLAGKSPEYVAKFKAASSLGEGGITAHVAQAGLQATKRAEEAQRNARANSTTADPTASRSQSQTFGVRCALGLRETAGQAALSARVGMLSHRAPGEVRWLWHRQSGLYDCEAEAMQFLSSVILLFDSVSDASVERRTQGVMSRARRARGAGFGKSLATKFSYF